MLTKGQVNQFKADGFMLIEGMFSASEVHAMNSEASLLSKNECDKRILEKDGSMRSYFAAHEDSRLMDAVSRIDRMVLNAQQLLNDDVYIHQTKVNSKAALSGDWWEWHQDFPYWHIEDCMPRPDVLTIMIFLDEANDFNGPLLLIPGSQNAGLVDETANEQLLDSKNDWFNHYQQSKTYMSNLTANLKYTLKQHTLMKWMKQQGIVAAKGPAGTAVIFDGLVFHASSNNLSPWNRNTYLVTYNKASNKLAPMDNPRPSFLANRDFSPIKPMPGTHLKAIVDECMTITRPIGYI